MLFDIPNRLFKGENDKSELKMVLDDTYGKMNFVMVNVLT